MPKNRECTLNQKTSKIGGDTELRQMDIGPIIVASLEPFAPEIAEICNGGHVAVVVYEPHSSMRKTCKAIAGYRGMNCICRLPRLTARGLSHLWHAIGDHAAAEWLLDGSKNRVFLIAEMATLCITLDADGIKIERRTIDAEWQKYLS